MRADASRAIAATEAGRHVQAWTLLVAALALHVVDEAATGFLGFYNPLVLSIRLRLPWFPMPTFTFGIWLAGLVTLVIVLAASRGLMRRATPGARAGCWVFAAIMLLNGLGHLLGSLYFQRWLPGTRSAPVLIVASIWLGVLTWRRSEGLRTARR